MGDDWRGRVIDGRYTVESVLGSGGMGLVLKARHKFTGAEVALKVLRPELELDPEVQMRFLGEARAPNVIGHPGIVQVVDAGKAPDGLLYLVMELLTGRPLRVPMACGELTRPDLRRIMMELFDALSAAHARGFVHRDLKPENVFLAGPVGTVKLLDFGIAKVLDVGLARVKTATGATLGTPAYMAPEQFNDPSSVDARADLWAAGVMIYEMMCGRLPFQGPTAAALLIAVATKEPTPVRAYLPAAPPAVEAFFERALSRDLSRRFASAQDMAQAFAALPLGAQMPTFGPAGLAAGTAAGMAGTMAPAIVAGHAATVATGPGVPVGAAHTPMPIGAQTPMPGRPHTPTPGVHTPMPIGAQTPMPGRPHTPTPGAYTPMPIIAQTPMPGRPHTPTPGASTPMGASTPLLGGGGMLSGPPAMPGPHASEWASRPGGSQPTGATPIPTSATPAVHGGTPILPTSATPAVHGPAPYPGAPASNATPYPGAPASNATPYPGAVAQPAAPYPGAPASNAAPYPGAPASNAAPYPGAAAQPAAPPTLGGAPPTLTGPAGTHITAGPPRSRAGLILGIVGIVALIAAIAVVATNRGGGDKTVAKPGSAVPIDAAVVAHAPPIDAAAVAPPVADAAVVAQAVDAAVLAPLRRDAGVARPVPRDAGVATVTPVDAGVVKPRSPCAPRGTGSCRAAMNCQRGCEDEDSACRCACAAAMHPAHTEALTEFAACARSCGYGKICMGLNCKKKVATCLGR